MKNFDHVIFFHFISCRYKITPTVNSYRISHIVSLDPTVDHITILQHKHEFSLMEGAVDLPVNKFEKKLIRAFLSSIMNGFSISNSKKYKNLSTLFHIFRVLRNKNMYIWNIISILRMFSLVLRIVIFFFVESAKVYKIICQTNIYIQFIEWITFYRF